MDKSTRNAIERATQQARKLLDDDFSSQLEGTFDVMRSGVISPSGGVHLSARQQFQRGKIVAAIDHKRAAGVTAQDAVTDYVRDAAFTTLNRFIALKMLEARELVQECITKGEQSGGYREFCGMAPGVALLPEAAGYRLYVESLFDEFSTEIKVLFDRRDAASVLWPKRQTFDALLTILNAPELSGVWAEDETIGWVYQFFNSSEERRKMRDESTIPRNSRELAVRNQFFTPRYVVQFLVDNTLGRIWSQTDVDHAQLDTMCKYLVRHADDRFESRTRRDPRDLRILDPACGSGHFLLYSFDLLLTIYEEAWAADGLAPKSELTTRTLLEDYPDLTELRRAAPRLIVEHNLHGVDIDPRCAQIAALALWLRAQRAWKDRGVVASDRPRIQRTHIVVAEAMPGDAGLVEEFAARLDPPLLRDLFKKMVGESRLAGELGTLLRAEDGIAAELHRAREQFVSRQRTTRFLPGMEPAAEPGSLDLSGIDDDQFFHEAESLIIEALRDFAETASGSANVRRRLFAGDAAQGIALIDLVRTRFDVVLMNPPFGACSSGGKKEFENSYPRTKNDLYAAFVERGIQLLRECGLLGSITSGTYFNLSTFKPFRTMLLSDWSSHAFVDLGTGVMDDAAVTAACAVVEKSTPVNGDQVAFFDMRFASNRSDELLHCVADLDADRKSRTTISLEILKRLPDGVFAYWLTEGVQGIFARFPALDQGATATFGLHCRGGDERFYRAWWEVDPSQLDENAWPSVFLGGTPQRLYRDCYYVVDWRANARVLREVASRATGGTFTGKDYYFRSGLTYIYTAQTTFSVQPLPRGSVFTAAAHGVFINKEQNIWVWLAWLNSEPVRLITKVINPNRFFQASYVRSIPIPDFSLVSAELESLAREGVALALKYVSGDERSRYFIGDWALSCRPDPGSSIFNTAVDAASIIAARLSAIQERINELVIVAYGLSDDDLRVMSERIGPSTAQALPGSVDLMAGGPVAAAAEHLSVAFGVAIGRWEPNQFGRVEPNFEKRDPFEPLPVPVAIRRPGPGVGILVDDEGHRDDLGARISDVIRDAWGDHSDTVLSELRNLFPSDDFFRSWFSSEFFSYHLSHYSFSQAKAPIYWQLSTQSGSFSLWLYVHAFTNDTLFRVQNEYVAQKLLHEERKLEVLAIELRNNANAAERKALATQESFVQEIREFLGEVKLVSPLWNPKLDDGVSINFAPLWRLVPQHKAMQKELKATWDALCEGAYDWTHLAMHLWPERVVPKCANDRSLAITHGLESVLWAEGRDGKWTPQPNPTRSVDELVTERTSVAVKAALKGLNEASVPNVSKAKKRRSSS